MSTKSSLEMKIGRKKAQTWGRTTGGFKPKFAKISKRMGSKGSRKVAKENIRREICIK